MNQIIKAEAVHLTFLMAQMTVGAWLKSASVQTRICLEAKFNNSGSDGHGRWCAHSVHVAGGDLEVQARKPTQ